MNQVDLLTFINTRLTKYDLDGECFYDPVGHHGDNRFARVVEIAKELGVSASILVKYNTPELLSKYQQAHVGNVQIQHKEDVDPPSMDELIAMYDREDDFQRKMTTRVIGFNLQMRFLNTIHVAVTNKYLRVFFMPLCHVLHYMFKRNVGIAFFPLNLVVLDENTLAKMIFANSATGFICSTLKQVIKAPRPNYIDHDLIVPGYTSGGFSTPSLHAALAGSGSVIFGCFFNSVAGWFTSISLLVSTMASRMMLGVHYPQDVLIGSMMGVTVSLITEFCTRGITLRIWSWEFVGPMITLISLNLIAAPLLTCFLKPQSSWRLYVYNQEDSPPHSNRKTFWSAMATAGNTIGLVTIHSAWLSDTLNLSDIPIGNEFGLVFAIFAICYFSSFMIEFLRNGIVAVTAFCLPPDAKALANNIKNPHKMTVAYNTIEGLFYALYAWANLAIAASIIVSLSR